MNAYTKPLTLRFGDMKKHNLILGILIVIAFIIRLVIILHPLNTLVTYNGDDMYYYLEIADNIVQGHGVSFDGIHITNGFHPLYLLLILPIVKMFLFNKILASYSALILLMLFNVFTAIFVYRIVNLLTKNKDAGIISAFIWLFNPWNIFIPLTGVEVAIASFFIASSLYAYIYYRIKSNNDFSKFKIWPIISIGILLGLAILSRSDSILIAIAIGLDVIYQMVKNITKKNVTKNLKSKKFLEYMGKLALLVCVVLIIIAPWVIWSKLNTGLWVQGSGSALMYNSRAGLGVSEIINKVVFNTGFSIFKIFNYTVTAPFLALVVGLILGSIIKYKFKLNKTSRNILVAAAIILLLYSSSIKEAVHYPAGLIIAIRLAIISAIVFVIGLISGLNTKIASLKITSFKEKSNNKEIKNSASNLPVIIGFILFAGFYSILFWHHQPWYFLSILLLIIILLGNFFDVMLVRMKKFGVKKAFLLLLILFAVLFGIRFAVLYNSSICPWQYDMYEGAVYLKNLPEIPADANIGAFNAGIFAYFSDRTIVNLDGVVNYDIVEYRKSGGNTIGYLRENNIQYVIDYPCFLTDFKNDLTPIYNVPVKYDPFCENSGPVLYKVNSK